MSRQFVWLVGLHVMTLTGIIGALLARAIAPRRLVPIHSFAPERFGEFFESVEVHRDGEWWRV